jgi:hypothetical protein
MEVLDRHYTCHEFKYEGQLDKTKGAYPIVQIGFAIQNYRSETPTLDVAYDLKYSNFDGSISFVIQCEVKVNFHLAKPDENEIYDEVKNVIANADKILVMECTKIKKYTIPNKTDVDKMKEKVLDLIRSQIYDID